MVSYEDKASIVIGAYVVAPVQFVACSYSIHHPAFHTRATITMAMLIEPMVFPRKGEYYRLAP